MTSPTFVCHHAERSGGELALADLLPELADRTPRVLVGADGPMVDVWSAAGASVTVVPHSHRSGLRESGPALALLDGAKLVDWGRRLRASSRGELLIANSLPAGLALAATHPRPSGIWAIHDHVSSDYLGPAAVRSSTWALRRWRGPLVANSSSTQALLPPQSHSVVIPPATAPLSMRAGAVGSDSPLVVAVLGRLAPWKGQHVAIDAFADAFGGGPEQLLVIGGPVFGEVDYERELKSQIEARGIGLQVRMIGHVDDPSAALRDAHVLVHSSVLPEPFGRVLVEGLSAGLSVVATDSPATREILDQGRFGLLVSPGSVSELAAALTNLSDGVMITRFSAAGPERAGLYAPARVGPSWHRLLDDTSEAAQ